MTVVQCWLLILLSKQKAGLKHAFVFVCVHLCLGWLKHFSSLPTSALVWHVCHSYKQIDNMCLHLGGFVWIVVFWRHLVTMYGRPICKERLVVLQINASIACPNIHWIYCFYYEPCKTDFEIWQIEFTSFVLNSFYLTATELHREKIVFWSLIGQDFIKSSIKVTFGVLYVPIDWLIDCILNMVYCTETEPSSSTRPWPIAVEFS